MIGIVSIEYALKQSSIKGLDLVEITSKTNPPVCKILNAKRYKYDIKKQIQEQKKKLRKASLREVRFKINIGKNDLSIKITKIQKFLINGDKVKISLLFKGREILYKNKGYELLTQILNILGSKAKVDSTPKMEGKQIIVIISHNP